MFESIAMGAFFFGFRNGYDDLIVEQVKKPKC